MNNQKPIPLWLKLNALIYTGGFYCATCNRLHSYLSNWLKGGYCSETHLIFQRSGRLMILTQHLFCSSFMLHLLRLVYYYNYTFICWLFFFFFLNRAIQKSPLNANDFSRVTFANGKSPRGAALKFTPCLHCLGEELVCSFWVWAASYHVMGLTGLGDTWDWLEKK